MADNVQASASTNDGAIFATDEAVGSVHHPYVKLEFGADNTQTPVDSSNPLPVDLASGSALTALQVIDNPVFADDVAFTLTSSSVMMAGAIRDDSLTTLTAVEGDAVPLRVSSTGALHVTGGGGGTEYTEDEGTANPIVGTATLMERDDALTTVTPIEGDWIGLRGSAEGALWTQDFNSDGILADTNTIAGDTTSIDGKITACNTGAVVISSGTITAVTDITNTIDSTISGAALTALQLIDDTVYTDDADWTDSTSKHMLVGGLYQSVPQTITDGDVGPLQVDSNGNLITAVTGTVTVDGSGVTQPVSGTVTANLGATDNAVLDSIDAAVNGTLTVGSHAVTNAGTFAVQISDTSFAVADGSALGEGVLVQGDDGTDRKNINVDATTGDVQVDVTNTVTVDGSGVTQPVSGTVTANLSATDNAVLDTIDAVLDTINAKLVTGTDIGDVTINNAAGASAVNIQDGGNNISVDWGGTVPPIGAGTEAAALRVTLATDSTGQVTVDGTVTANLSSTDNTVLDNIQTAVELIDNAISGTEMQVDVVAALPAGANLVGDVGISGARTSGGCTPYFNDGTCTETQIKGTATQVYFIAATNTSASPVFLQLFNATAASVTPGTTTATLEFIVPTQGDTNGGGFMLAVPNGITFSTALTFICSTAAGGGTAATAGSVLLNVGYA